MPESSPGMTLRTTSLRAAAILDGKAGGLDEAAPALDLLLDLALELRTGLARDLEPLPLELLFHGGIGVRRFGGLGQPIEDLLGHAFLHQEAEPNLGREFGITELRESRYLRHRAVARRPRGGERLELAGTHVRQRGIDLRKPEQRMAAEQAGHLQAGAAIGHMREVEVKLLVHLEAEEVRRCSRLIGRVA